MPDDPVREAVSAPELKRVLGRRDLVLLFVVAVANLNIVPAIAAAGAITIPLWLLAFLVYFWPQGIAVTELSHRWPGEGGIYLWTRNSFGEGHGFLAGWCYWLSNVLYLPTILLSSVGVGVYVFGPSIRSLAQDDHFTALVSGGLLVLLLLLNIRGEQFGKLVTNLGGVGTVVGAALVCALAGFTLRSHSSALHLGGLPAEALNWRRFAVFGTICYSLQGLELASMMGDEIREPRKVLPGAIFRGGVISAAIYLGVTTSMLVAMPGREIGVLSGVLQAISLMAERVGLGKVVAPLALFEFCAIVGAASAWFGGSARVPFVAGVDQYLPRALGRLHPRYGTPYVALAVFALLSSLLLAASYLGASVSEAYLTLLAIAVILQMVPNLYMFGALYKGARSAAERRETPRPLLPVSAVAGMLASAAGLGLAFVPAPGTTHIAAYEAKLVGASVLIFGSALGLYLRHRKLVNLAPGDPVSA